MARETMAPRPWKVIQTDRETFTGLRPVTPRSILWTLRGCGDRRSPCRDRAKISQPPTPFDPIPRGRAGPGLLPCATGLEHMAHDGAPRSKDTAGIGPRTVGPNAMPARGEPGLSTPADQVGAVTGSPTPLTGPVEAHTRAAARLHGADATVPLPARSGTKTARFRPHLRDDRPHGAAAPPAVASRFARDRGGEHPSEHPRGWQGILQAAAYTSGLVR